MDLKYAVVTLDDAWLDMKVGQGKSTLKYPYIPEFSSRKALPDPFIELHFIFGFQSLFNYVLLT